MFYRALISRKLWLKRTSSFIFFYAMIQFIRIDALALAISIPSFLHISCAMMSWHEREELTARVSLADL